MSRRWEPRAGRAVPEGVHVDYALESRGSQSEVVVDIRELRANLRGSLLQPGEAGYDAARRVWNGAIDRKPALIARCAGPADVLAAVNFARANQLLVSVRGGGHNVTGNAVCDGGLMIDLSPMKGIRVDRQ